MNPSSHRRQNIPRVRGANDSAGRFIVLLVLALLCRVTQGGEVRFHHMDAWEIPILGPVGLVQCCDGFLWLIDSESLWRYDGRTFREMIPDTSGDSLPRSWIQKDLIGGHGGVLGIYGSSNEFVLYDINRNRATVVTLPPPRSQPGRPARVVCAAEDRRGMFLIGTEAGELYRLDPTTLVLETLPALEGLPHASGSRRIADVLEDAGGDLWVATSSGVVRMAGGGSFERYSRGSDLPRRLPSDDIVALEGGREGRIWVLSREGKFGWIDTQESAFAECPPAVRYSNRLDNYTERGGMCMDSDGSVWVRPRWGGVMRWDPQTGAWEAYLTSSSDPHEQSGVVASFVSLDNSGNLWIGTNGEGMYRLSRTAGRFHSYSAQTVDPSGLSSSNVLSLWCDQGGVLWVGTQTSGLNSLLPGARHFRVQRHNPLDPTSLPSNFVTCVRDRNPDELWLGMVGGGGVCVLNKQTGRITRSTAKGSRLENLGSDTVTALHQDRSGTMWVGHYRGLDRYDDAAGVFRPVVRWDRETVGVMGSVAHITDDDGGNVWLACVDRGLARINVRTGGIAWYHYRPGDPRSLPSQTTWCVGFDQTRHTVWVPGEGWEVARYDAAADAFVRFRLSPFFDTSARLPVQNDPSESSPTGITADVRGNLWIAVWGAMVKFNPDSNTCVFYGQSDGIAVANTRRNAFQQTDDGTIYFGGSGGVSWFHPERLWVNTVPPQVALTRFAVFGQPVDLRRGVREISLSHREHTFSFDFAALEFTNPERNQFMYKLEGSAGSWINQGTDGRIRFANVSPGNYLLRVRASNSDGIWSAEAFSIAIHISAPYWEQAWFRTLLAVLLAGMVAGMYRYQQSRKRGLEQLRVRIANDLHDDIGSELSAIALESALIARRLHTAPDQRRRVQEVGRAVRDAAENLRHVVWIVNPEQEKLTDLVGRMRSVASSLLTGMEVSINVPHPPRPLPLAMIVKRHILLMYKEILNNVVRHAAASRVSILIETLDGTLHLCVKDNGCGFEGIPPLEGRGLKSIRTRAEQLGGTLEIESEPGRGTTVCFRGRITRLKD